jgi:hypothetical protein
MTSYAYRLKLANSLLTFDTKVYRQALPELEIVSQRLADTSLACCWSLVG